MYVPFFVRYLQKYSIFLFYTTNFNFSNTIDIYVFILYNISAKYINFLIYIISFCNFDFYYTYLCTTDFKGVFYMKKISKILTGLLSAIAIGSIAIVPMDASALAKLLGYDSNGKEIYGGYFDELVGFDEDGNPIIVNTDPSITIATATPPLPEVEQTTEESQVTTVAEKKIEILDVSNVPKVLLVFPNGKEYFLSGVDVEVGYAPIFDEVDETFDKSIVEKTITFDENDGGSYLVTVYFPHMSTNIIYDAKQDILLAQGAGLGLDDKYKTEFTVGDSTFPRGDINLDGKVNTVDLLMLKKYLLGLMEW